MEQTYLKTIYSLGREIINSMTEGKDKYFFRATSSLIGMHIGGIMGLVGLIETMENIKLAGDYRPSSLMCAGVGISYLMLSSLAYNLIKDKRLNKLEKI